MFQLVSEALRPICDDVSEPTVEKKKKNRGTRCPIFNMKCRYRVLFNSISNTHRHTHAGTHTLTLSLTQSINQSVSQLLNQSISQSIYNKSGQYDKH